MRGGYYNKAGEAITQEQWGELHVDPDYKVIALETLSDGMKVSTVWLGINHAYSPELPPLIFETMIFSDDEELNGQMWRYETEEQARENHEQVVRTLKDNS